MTEPHAPAAPDLPADVPSALRAWAADGVSVVRVLDRHGFGTVESGQIAVGRGDGTVVGEVLRGALPDQLSSLARSTTTRARRVEAHVAEDDAVAAGLACAGGATLLGHPLAADAATALGTAMGEGTPAALITPVDGRTQLVLTGPELIRAAGGLGEARLDIAAQETALRLLRRGVTATERTSVGDPAVEILLDLWVPTPGLLIIGGGALADALVAQAEVLGWGCGIVTTPEVALASVRAFTDADALVLLDHSADFDPVLVQAARGGRGFLGLLGSRHTQATRRERLRTAGLTAEELARFHGPVGLDLGSRTPAETAVSIVAEIIATRAGRSGAALAAASGRIGV